MKKDTLAIVIAVAIVLLAGGGILVASTRGSDDAMNTMSATSSTGDVPSIDTAKESRSVDIKNFAFGPQAIKIKAGTKVTWTNQDTIKHNAVKDEGQSDGPDGPLLKKGESYSYTYEKPGTYTYHCDPHRSMVGVVYVTE